MDSSPSNEEWSVIADLLPSQWREQARPLGAFLRARYLPSPDPLLRLLLLHALGGSLQQTVAEANAGGIATMSAPALYFRIKQSGAWLRWIAEGLSGSLRSKAPPASKLRPRVVDSTTIQGPGSTTSEWRIHYTLDLFTLFCDWHELSPASTAESLARTPIRPGDVLIADRNYLKVDGIRAVAAGGGHVLVRMRWRHPAMRDHEGKPFKILDFARKTKVGVPSETHVRLMTPSEPLEARVIAIKLPAPLAEANRRRLARSASRKQRANNPKSEEAAGYVFLFTTVPQDALDAQGVADLYRHRWQIELAFKRHKQLLRLGRLPHKDPEAATAWILAKLVVALLLETLYRNAETLSPWGFEFRSVTPEHSPATQ